ncbi:MAG: hypothetical protein ACR2GQ_10205 [Gemmatimonadota bacterium]
MNILDILITIIVVTILVTIVLGVITYIAYKLRLARRPSVSQDNGDGTWYFERHEPGAYPHPEVSAASSTEPG